MSNSTNESDVGWIVAQSQLDPPQNNEGRLKGKISKRPWTPEEDAILKEYVKNYGREKWDKVKKHYNLDRTGKSCRFRYVNHLDPTLKKGPFTQTEKQLIIQLHEKFGNQWALIAKELPGRRDNQIKNFWNTLNKKRKKRKRISLPTDHKRISLPCDPPAVPAQLYIGNPIQSMGDYNSAYDRIQHEQIWAVNARGGNPESFFEGCKSHTGDPLYGRASLDSSRNIVSSQDFVSQVRGFTHFSSARPQANQIFPGHSSVSSARPQANQIFPGHSSVSSARPQAHQIFPGHSSVSSTRRQAHQIFPSHSTFSSTRPQAHQSFPSHSTFSSTRPQAHQSFLPGSPYDYFGRSTQPSIFSNEYGSNMITNNIVSMGGGAISANHCLINSNCSTSRTSLGAEEAELPSFQCSKIQYHDQYHDANSLALHSPKEVVPIQSDSRCVENMFEGLLGEADNMVDFMLEFDEFSDLDSFSERSNAPVFIEPTPDELASSQGHSGMEIAAQKETSDAITPMGTESWSPSWCLKVLTA